MRCNIRLPYSGKQGTQEKRNKEKFWIYDMNYKIKENIHNDSKCQINSKKNIIF